MKKTNRNNKNASKINKRNARRVKAQLVVCPTLDQWDTTSLIKSDFDGKGVVKALVPYNTAGREVVRARLQQSLAPYYQAASTTTVGALYFTLASCAGYADYATVFDQYCVEAVSVSFQPQFTSAAATTSVLYPRLFTCLDYDDAAVPSNQSYVQQYGSCVEAPPFAGVIRTLVPSVSKAAYQSGLTAYVSDDHQWVDMAYTSVQHYGVKFAIEAGLASQTILQGYSIDVTLYVAFRVTR